MLEPFLWNLRILECSNHFLKKSLDFETWKFIERYLVLTWKSQNIEKKAEGYLGMQESKLLHTKRPCLMVEYVIVSIKRVKECYFTSQGNQLEKQGWNVGNKSFGILYIQYLFLHHFFRFNV